MGYLIARDYKQLIQDAVLTQIIGGDALVLSAGEQVAQAEIVSYLAERYELADEFKPVTAFDSAGQYNAGDRVTNGSGELYFASYPAPLFVMDGQYSAGDQVFWKNKIYTCQVGTQGISRAEVLQYARIQNVPARNILPDDAGMGGQYWGAGVVYSVPVGSDLTDGSRWTKGDSRNPQVVQLYTDMVIYHLVSRISPQNVPKVREDRYNNAVHWLKAAAEGKITPGLKVIQARPSTRIRYGGNIKNNNSY